MDGSLLRIAALCAALAVCELPAAQQESEPLPIAWEAESFALDRNSLLLTFEGLRLTHGELELSADSAVATGLDSGSEWQFSGHVRVVVGNALLEADSARFTFGEGELALAELVGDPATFTDTSPERDEPAVGGANLLAYDYAARTLRLSDGARLRVGQN